ncbi:MAG: FmdE family protein [candidate division NC10 bacterium]
MRDSLAEFLGALAPGGTFQYAYEDAVKLSGHSCPTVAGAYLMTAVALRALYPDGVGVRGDVEVTMGGPPDDGGTGPMAQVIALLTGAAPQTGFGGLAGKFRRKDLLTFDPALEGRVRFRRGDTGAAVEVTYTPGSVPPAPEMSPLMVAALGGRATADEQRRFGELWQARVRDILDGDPARVVQVARVA